MIRHVGSLAFHGLGPDVQKGGTLPPFYEKHREPYLRLAVVRLVEDFLRAAVFRGRRAALVRFLAVLLLRDVDRLAVLLLRAVDRFAVDFLLRVAAAFLAAVERFADLRLRVAAAFFAAVDRLAVLLLRAVDLLRVAAIGHLLSNRQDAMRFRRRRSRSLSPPHTP
jgi:hypothetical protein